MINYISKLFRVISVGHSSLAPMLPQLCEWCGCERSTNHQLRYITILTLNPSNITLILQGICYHVYAKG